MIRLSEMRELVCDDGRRARTYVFSWDEPRTPTFRFEHDKDKKLFVLTWPDGRVESFRDNPAAPTNGLARSYHWRATAGDETRLAGLRLPLPREIR